MNNKIDPKKLVFAGIIGLFFGYLIRMNIYPIIGSSIELIGLIMFIVGMVENIKLENNK